MGNIHTHTIAWVTLNGVGFAGNISMKTVKLNNGDIVRVKDSIAKSLVTLKEGVYVPKKTWKSRVRDANSTKSF